MRQVQTGWASVSGQGTAREGKWLSHLTEGNTEALSFQGPTAGAVGSEEQGSGPESGWGILGAGVQGVWGAGALPETDGSTAPSPPSPSPAPAPESQRSRRAL